MQTSVIGLPCSSTTTPSSRNAVPGFMLGVGDAGRFVGGTNVGRPSGAIARIGDDDGSTVGVGLGATLLGPQAMIAARSGTPRSLGVPRIAEAIPLEREAFVFMAR